MWEELIQWVNSIIKILWKEFHNAGTEKLVNHPMAKIKFVEIPQSENCILLRDSSSLMGEKCLFIGSVGPFLENSIR